MLTAGQLVERYRIDSVIGQGGMATVYKATHVQLHSEHALKVLGVSIRSVADRLLEEGRAQARIRHPNLVRVTDYIEIDHLPALVMEYVDGPALDQWLAQHRPTLDEALALFRGICSGVAAAHRHGVIHRDLKPANVLLEQTHTGLVPRVTDFGLVKAIAGYDGLDRGGVTMSGTTLGTPEYMAPEQVRDASRVDQRADLFSLGCLLYELVTGQRAFAGADTLSVFNRLVEGRYTPPQALVPDLPPQVARVIARLLQVDPAQRPADCDEVLAMLFAEPRVEAIGAPSQSVRPAPARGRSHDSLPWLLAMGAGCAAGVCVAAVVALYPAFAGAERAAPVTTPPAAALHAECPPVFASPEPPSPPLAAAPLASTAAAEPVHPTLPVPVIEDEPAPERGLRLNKKPAEP